MPAGRQVPGLPSIWESENIYLLLSDVFTHTAYLTVGDNTGHDLLEESIPLYFSSCFSSSLLSRPTFPPPPSTRSLRPTHAFQTARQLRVRRDNYFPLLPLRRLVPTQ